MFVADSHIILKTCGTTRLMDALDYLLELAEKYAGFTDIKVTIALKSLYSKNTICVSKEMVILFFATVCVAMLLKSTRLQIYKTKKISY